MIDRKALWTLVLLCLAMTTAAIWRLSLLPDWTQIPFPTPKGMVTKSGLVLFIEPLALLFVIAVFAVQKWLIPGPAEALAVWYRRTRLLPMLIVVAMVLAQTFIISRSLGYGLDLDAQAMTRTIIVATGILVIVLGNVRPKLPRLSKRFALLDLDPWQSVRNSRFAGRMTVAMGLAVIVAAILLPLRAMTTTIFIVWLGFCGAIIWHFVMLKREPSPRP
jgi:hypothetical protein